MLNLNKKTPSFNKFNKFVFNGIKYIYSQHYSNLNKLFKENKRSNKTFNLNENEITALIAYLKSIDKTGSADPRTFIKNYDGTIEQ